MDAASPRPRQLKAAVVVPSEDGGQCAVVAVVPEDVSAAVGAAVPPPPPPSAGLADDFLAELLKNTAAGRPPPPPPSRASTPDAEAPDTEHAPRGGGGRSLPVHWSPTSSIWVGNLQADVRNGEVDRLFGSYGATHSVVLKPVFGARGKAGEPPVVARYGFVNMFDVESAVCAVRNLEGYARWPGSRGPLTLRFAWSFDGDAAQATGGTMYRPDTPVGTPTRHVLVTPADYDVHLESPNKRLCEPALLDAFRKYRVTAVTPATCNTFAFVDFAHTADAEDAVRDLDNRESQHLQCRVRLAFCPSGKSRSAERSATCDLRHRNEDQPRVRARGSSSSDQRSSHPFPMRIDVGECYRYQANNGYCKYKASCKFHHTPFSAVGPCPSIANGGTCDAGPLCSYDHPSGIYVRARCKEPSVLSTRHISISGLSSEDINDARVVHLLLSQLEGFGRLDRSTGDVAQLFHKPEPQAFVSFEQEFSARHVFLQLNGNVWRGRKLSATFRRPAAPREAQLADEERSRTTKRPRHDHSERISSKHEDALKAWLERVRLGDFLPALTRLGVATLEDLLDVEPEDLATMSMSKVQTNRFIKERAFLQQK